MTRRRTDDNHSSIATLFRQLGCSVADTSQLGAGFPDLVVGHRGRNLLVEVKDGNKWLSRQKLTAAEAEFHDAWRGQVCVVTSAADVLRLVRGS